MSYWGSYQDALVESYGYYEVPEHCTECGIETQREDGLCTHCWKERKAEMKAAESERA